MTHFLLSFLFFVKKCFVQYFLKYKAIYQELQSPNCHLNADTSKNVFNSPQKMLSQQLVGGDVVQRYICLSDTLSIVISIYLLKNALSNTFWRTKPSIKNCKSLNCRFKADTLKNVFSFFTKTVESADQIRCKSHICYF